MVIHNKYRVLDVLGKGGGGVVYKVRDEALGRILAVKEIPWKKQSEHVDCVREKQILKECFHPALPLVIDGFEEGAHFYLVMEYVEGITLKEYIIRRGRLSEKEAVAFSCQLAQVLIYLHTRNQPIIYGDLQPENVMVTKEGKLRLLDFGTALREEETEIREGAYGSLGYASPEQRQGKGAVIASDVYSLGALLHFMLTGEDPCKPPYIRRSLRECNSTLPKALEKIVNRCLREEPLKRYQSVEGLQRDLQGYRRSEGNDRRIRVLKGCIPVLLCLTAVYFYYRNLSFIGVILIALGVLSWFFMRGSFGGRYSYCIEKNIWRTDKRGIGFFLLLFLLGAVLLEADAEAKPRQQSLPVILYDAAGYKLCLKEDSEYRLQGDFRMEVPQECFAIEESCTVTIQVQDSNDSLVGMKQFKVVRKD